MKKQWKCLLALGMTLTTMGALALRLTAFKQRPTSLTQTNSSCLMPATKLFLTTKSTPVTAPPLL